MKIFIFVPLIVSIYFIPSIHGDYEKSFKDAKHPGKCVIRDDLILSPYETAPDPEVGCGRMLCLDDAVVAFQSCKFHDRKPYCPPGKEVPYPDCCVVCLF